MGRMSFLQPLLAADPASPRLTVYDESTGARMEFSATTLDNWVSKIANMMTQEFDAEADTRIVLDVPVTWQAAVIPLGMYAVGCTPLFAAEEDSREADIVFTSLERIDDWPDAEDIVVVSGDPFGRGVEESGGQLPVGTVDFSPTVRFYGDQYFGPTTELAGFAREGVEAKRYLVGGWATSEEFDTRVMAPLAAGGSAVVVTGIASTERLESIATMEKTTGRL